jgi:lysozyme
MRSWLALALLGAGCGAGFDEFNQASTQQCPQTTVEGVDVYQGDGTVAWATVKSSGRAFAFAKASQGTGNKQSTFAANWSALKSLGILRGAYHYFDATADGVAQANWFLTQLNAAGGLEPGDLPPALDLECPTSPTQSSAGNMCLGNGKSGWAPTATIIQGVWDWLDTVEAATGMKPVIYSYVSWFGDFGFTDPRLTEYPLWIASVASPTCAAVPAPWTKATFWQYASNMHVPGIGSAATVADEDRFMGTEGELEIFAANAFPARDGGADGMLDGGTVDLAPVDLAEPAPTVDEGAPDDLASPPQKSHDGCGCQLGSAHSPPPGAALLLLGALLFFRRRRHGSQ